MRSADVVVIGAGAVGASIAWHLASRHAGRIIVIDRGVEAGEGSTGRATGGFRAQFGSAISVQLSLLSREKLLRFRDEVGGDPGYVQVGYLFLAGTDRDLSLLKDAIEVQKSVGFHETRVLDRDEARRVNPAVNPDFQCGATFSPSDGFIRPRAILDGYLEAARRLGVEVDFGVESISLEVNGSRITTVHASKGDIATEAVVNAGGPWAAGIVRSAGVNLPVVPLRRQVASTVPTTLLPSDMPMTIFASDGFHLRVRDGRVLLLWPHEPAGDPGDPTFEEGWLEPIRRMTDERIPLLRTVPIDRQHCWAGLYEVSPDRHAILGCSMELENLYLANGSSGHGVMHSPAIGQLVAEVITEGTAKSIDIHELRPARFVEGAPIGGSALL